MAVPLFATDIEPLLPAIAERMREVLESGRYILGPQVAAFEAELADYLGVAHCVGVANGTDALTIALRGLEVGPGDEVVVPAVTFYATAEAVVNVGATPVFADVEPGTWCVSADTVDPVLTDRTAAIVPVHLFGRPAPMPELSELVAARSGRPIRVLEDAAEAIGANLDGRMAGSLGDAAAFSFYPSKNLGAFGDAGAIVTDDDEVAATCRLLRAHGSEDNRHHSLLGYNSRLDEIQAAALRVLLPELDAWTRARRSVASAYRELGLGDLVTLPGDAPGAEQCYYLYVVATAARDELARALAERGIEARVYFTPPLPSQPGLASHAPNRRFPGAEQYAAECLALPMGPALSQPEIQSVVEAVEEGIGAEVTRDRR